MQALSVAAILLCAGAAVAHAGDQCGRATDNELAAVRTAFLQTLKDPDSVLLADVCRVPQPNGSVALCGQANAKNGYGGYAGYRPFYYVLGAKTARVSSEETKGPDAMDFALGECMVCDGGSEEACLDKAKKALWGR